MSKSVGKIFDSFVTTQALAAESIHDSLILMPPGDLLDLKNDAKAYQEFTSFLRQRFSNQVADTLLRGFADETLTRRETVGAPSADVGFREQQLTFLLTVRDSIRDAKAPRDKKLLRHLAAFDLTIGSLLLVSARPVEASLRLARVFFRTAARHASVAGDTVLSANAWHHLGMAEANSRKYDRATRVYRRALEALDGTEQVRAAGVLAAAISCDLAVALLRAGDVQSAGKEFEHAKELAIRHEDILREACVNAFQSIWYIRTKNPDSAVHCATEALKVASAHAHTLYTVLFKKYLAVSLLYAGRNDEATKVLQDALDSARSNGFEHQIKVIESLSSCFTTGALDHVTI